MILYIYILLIYLFSFVHHLSLSTKVESLSHLSRWMFGNYVLPGFSGVDLDVMRMSSWSCCRPVMACVRLLQWMLGCGMIFYDMIYDCLAWMIWDDDL